MAKKKIGNLAHGGGLLGQEGNKKLEERREQLVIGESLALQSYL